MPDDLVFYTAAEVAAMLRLHLQVVQRKLQAGEIPGYRIGREWRVERAQLLGWLERYSNQHERKLTDRWFDKDGRLRAMPAQRAKRAAVLEQVVERFEARRSYPEREVNAILREVFPDDIAYLRRELVSSGLLTRDHGVYLRDPSSGEERGAAPLASR